MEKPEKCSSAWIQAVTEEAQARNQGEFSGLMDYM